MTFFHLQTFCFSHSFLSKYFRLLTLRGSALRKRIFTVVFGGIPITKIVFFASSRVPIFLISSMRLFSIYRKRSLIGSMHVFMLPMMTFSFFSPLTQSSSSSHLHRFLVNTKVLRLCLPITPMRVRLSNVCLFNAWKFVWIFLFRRRDLVCSAECHISIKANKMLFGEESLEASIYLRNLRAP